MNVVVYKVKCGGRRHTSGKYVIVRIRVQGKSEVRVSGREKKKGNAIPMISIAPHKRRIGAKLPRRSISFSNILISSLHIDDFRSTLHLKFTSLSLHPLTR